MGIEGITSATATAGHLPLVSLNHVSFVCRSVADSANFYQQVLGFKVVKRPSSFNFNGAWLFKYGIGIHLLESDSPSHAPPKKSKINPKDNHISFQCSDMPSLIAKLQAMNIQYVAAVVEEDGITVDQLFFHDPDGYMIEICNCNNFPVLPLSGIPDPLATPFYPLNRAEYKGSKEGNKCTDALEGQQVDRILAQEIMVMGISFVPYVSP